MALTAFTKEQLALLNGLIEHKVRFIVVGMSSALLQGAAVVTQDVDLWVEDLGSENFCAAVEGAGGFYIPPGIAGGNPPMLGPGEFRLFDLVTHLHGLGDFAEEWAKTLVIEVDGVKLNLLPLQRVIASKKAVNRDKDRAVLPALEAALAARGSKESN